MNNIRKIIEERLDNARNDYEQAWAGTTLYDILQGQIEAYQDCLNLMQPRTEQEILNDFEKLGYEITRKNNIIYLTKEDTVLKIECDLKRYSKCDVWLYDLDITMQEHKLLNELFEVWGWT